MRLVELILVNDYRIMIANASECIADGKACNDRMENDQFLKRFVVRRLQSPRSKIQYLPFDSVDSATIVQNQNKLISISKSGPQHKFGCRESDKSAATSSFWNWIWKLQRQNLWKWKRISRQASVKRQVLGDSSVLRRVLFVSENVSIGHYQWCVIAFSVPSNLILIHLTVWKYIEVLGGQHENSVHRPFWAITN